MSESKIETPNESKTQTIRRPVQTKISFEAIRGIKTVQQIAKENQIHPTQVNQWKQILIEDASSLFEGKRPSQDQDDWENERDRLHAKIGQQSVEIDWLAKKCKQLHL